MSTLPRQVLFTNTNSKFLYTIAHTLKMVKDAFNTNAYYLMVLQDLDLEILHVEWHNLTPSFAFLPERGIENYLLPQQRLQLDQSMPLRLGGLNDGYYNFGTRT